MCSKEGILNSIVFSSKLTQCQEALTDAVIPICAVLICQRFALIYQTQNAQISMARTRADTRSLQFQLMVKKVQNFTCGKHYDVQNLSLNLKVRNLRLFSHQKSKFLA